MKATDRRVLPRWNVSLSASGLGCAPVGGMYRGVPLFASQDLVTEAWNAGVRPLKTPIPPEVWERLKRDGMPDEAAPVPG